MKKIILAGMATLSLMANADGGGGFGAQSLIRDVSAANAGKEVIIPYKSVNAAKSTVSVRFDVYPVGSTTKLYSTPAKVFTLSALACNTNFGPIQVYKEEEQFTHVTGGVMQIDTVAIYRTCRDSNNNYRDRRETLMYGADVSMSGGVTWFKQFPDIFVGGVELINSDADAAYELMLAMSTPGKEDTSVRFMFMNPNTGLTEIGAKDRPEASAGFSNWDN